MNLCLISDVGTQGRHVSGDWDLILSWDFRF